MRCPGFMFVSPYSFLYSRGALRKSDTQATIAQLNTFHWHIVDSQSFPLVVPNFQDVAEKGAYSADSVYTPQDVAHIVSYAGAVRSRPSHHAFHTNISSLLNQFYYYDYSAVLTSLSYVCFSQREENMCLNFWTTGNRHAGAHLSYLQRAPGAHRVPRGVALVVVRRTSRRTTAPRLTWDRQFHRGLVELYRGVVPFDPVRHGRR